MWRRPLVLVVITGGAMALYGDTVGEGFGVNFHIPNNGNFKGFADGELETMSRMFKVARFDLKWANIETTCGEYDFSEFDPIVASFLGAGIRPYAILDYANTCYADDDQVCSSDKCVDGYSAWARAVANHYSDLGYAGNMTFTSTNEPDNDSMADISASTDFAMIKSAGQAFLDAGFDFTGGVTVGVDLDYQESLIDKGVLKYVAALSTHPYTHHDPEYKIEDLQNLRSYMDKNDGSKIKLLLDEWGYPYGGYPSGDDDPDSAANLLPRTWLVCLAFDLNCDLGIFFDWDGVYDSDSDSTNDLGRAATAFQKRVGVSGYFDKLAPICTPPCDPGATQQRSSSNNNTTTGTPTVGFKYPTYAARFKDAADDIRRFAVWTYPDSDDTAALGPARTASSSGESVMIGSGKSNYCWNVYNYLDKKADDQVCSDGDGNVQVDGVTEYPLYLAP